MSKKKALVRGFETLRLSDIPIVGGKNASLGELIANLDKKGIRVPLGFATTSDAYWAYVEHNGLDDRIRGHLDAYHDGSKSLETAGRAIRRLFERGTFPKDLEVAIRECYAALCEQYDTKRVSVAVRSSATAEDLPEASFAGQQESFLNIQGIEALLEACRKCYASLFTDRAIVYREHNGFDHFAVALSIGVQKMVRSDKAAAGVMFTIDTESGFPNAIVIDGSWGLGENIVKGLVTPDEFRVFKPLLKSKKVQPIYAKHLGGKKRKLIYASSGAKTTKQVDVSQKDRKRFVLNDDEVLTLARWAAAIEDHYEKPMDIEWAKDGVSGDLFIVQARPETVQSRRSGATLRRYTLKERGEAILEGSAIGNQICSGKAHVLTSARDSAKFPEGAVLVADMTDPDWVPIMKRAVGVVTNHGGRTSHAAIVSRELGLPAVIGTDHATTTLKTGQEITLSCAEGEHGRVYRGLLDFDVREIDLAKLPKTRTHIMLNVANPEAAMSWWNLPCEGIGLARMEFIINGVIKVHPRALLEPKKVNDADTRKAIAALTEGYADKADYFVDELARGIATIAASRFPDPVIVRMSDFKSNEYAHLLGGEAFEPKEENPMIGFRGASRYYSDEYREAFRLECRAIRQVREAMGFTNVIVMIPFCRTLEEADRVIEILKKEGLQRGKHGFQLYVMAEIPSNIVLAPEFAERFDGFSIGSNDLTQLVLGTDRDSDLLSHIFDERNPAVKRMIQSLIDDAHKSGVHVGICGQGPSDHPDFAEFLVENGIDSLSLNPDSVVDVRTRIAKLEKKLRKK